MFHQVETELSLMQKIAVGIITEVEKRRWFNGFQRVKTECRADLQRAKRKGSSRFFCACTLVVNHHQNDDSHVL